MYFPLQDHIRTKGQPCFICLIFFFRESVDLSACRVWPAVCLNSREPFQVFPLEEDDIEACRRTPGAEAGGSSTGTSCEFELFRFLCKRGERALLNIDLSDQS